MDSSDEFECTQVLHTSIEKDDEENIKPEKVQVACLEINGVQYPILNGDTKIGRDSKNCLIAINKKSVSAHHALIEVESGHHLISDLGSSNSTRLNGLLLKPHVRYNLTDGAVVQIADLRGLYAIGPSNVRDHTTSNDDIFDYDSPTPNTRVLKPALARGSLNFSGDESIIGSTPMKSEFKQPYPKGGLENTIYQQSTICLLSKEKLVTSEEDNSIYEAETQSSVDQGNDSSFLEDSLNSSSFAKATVTSFVVPCSQQNCSDPSLKLHLETDDSLNGSLFETSAASDNVVGGSENIHNAKTQIGAASDRETDEEGVYGACTEMPEKKEIESKNIDEAKTQTLCTNTEDSELEDKSIHIASAGRLKSVELKQPENTKCENSMVLEMRFSGLEETGGGGPRAAASGDIHDAKTQVVKSTNDDIHEAKTQLVAANVSDSETDEEDMYGASTEKPKKTGDIHDAKTQAVKPTNQDIHDAKTQLVAANVSDSETDEEDIYGASTEKPKKTDDIHDAKTQVVKSTNQDIHDAKTQLVAANVSDSETDEEDVYGASTEKPKKTGDIHDAKTQVVKSTNQDIHDAKTQLVAANVSDSETDEEDMYGASTEKPKKTDDIHDAKTQVVKSTNQDIHDAKTQLVAANVSDSETDEEDMYGASTEKPKKTDDIHDAKTQVVKSTNQDIHDAKTQLVAANVSDSETDEEDMYGASTEKPKNTGDIHDAKTQAVKPTKKDIHDAKTQLVAANVSDSETDEEDVYGASTEKPKKTGDIHDAKTQVVKSTNQDIHDAKTQLVAANVSDSETDEEDMYGANTEKPKKTGDIHDAKTQVVKSTNDDIHVAQTQLVAANVSDSETDEEDMYGANTEKPKETGDIHDAKTQAVKPTNEDIHDAKTQLVAENVSDSETDEEDMYGANTEKPKKTGDIHDTKTQAVKPTNEDIHDAKTQLVAANVSDSETDEEDMYGANTEKPKKTGDIHDAKTQAVKPTNQDIHDAKTPLVAENVSDSETDEEDMYGANTEKPKKTCDIHDARTQVVKSTNDDIHEANTQLVAANVSDSETDEEDMYGAGTEKPKNTGDIHEAKIEALKSTNEDIHEAKTQLVAANVSDSETDEEDTHEASTEKKSHEMGDNIHDAKTQLIVSVDSTPGEEDVRSAHTESVDQKSSNGMEDIHEAKTQLVSTNASDSDRDEDGVYGASTESPADDGEEEDIHEGKTQLVGTNASNSRRGGDCKSDNIHDAKTQVVAAELVNMNHEPNSKDNLSSARTQIVDPLRAIDSSCYFSDKAKSSLGARSDEEVLKAHRGKSVSDGRSSTTPDLPELVLKGKTPSNTEFADRKTESVSPPGSSVQSKKPTSLTNVSPRKRLSLRSSKKKVDVDNSTPTLNLINSNVKDNVFSGTTQALSTPGKADRSAPEDVPTPATQGLSRAGPSSSSVVKGMDNDDIFTAATQLLPSSAEVDEEVDVFSAATQILPSPQTSKLVNSGSGKTEVKICSPSTPLLLNPSLDKKLNEEHAKESNIFPSSSKVGQVPANDNTISTRSHKSVTRSESKAMHTSGSEESLSKTFSETVDKRYSRKRQSSQPGGSHMKRKLGSSPLEVNIEDTSSDSNVSVDNLIDEGSPEPIKTGDDDHVSSSSDISEKQSKVSVGKQNPEEPVKLQVREISPIIPRNSGRRTLSLAKSRNSRASPGTSSLNNPEKITPSNDKECTGQFVSGVRPLAEKDYVKEKFVESVTSNVSQRESRRTRGSETSTENNTTAKEKIESQSQDSGKSILKQGTESGPRKKSVTFIALEETTAPDSPVKQKTGKGANSLKTSSRSQNQSLKVTKHDSALQGAKGSNEDTDSLKISESSEEPCEENFKPSEPSTQVSQSSISDNPPRGQDKKKVGRPNRRAGGCSQTENQSVTSKLTKIDSQKEVVAGFPQADTTCSDIVCAETTLPERPTRSSRRALNKNSESIESQTSDSALSAASGAGSRVSRSRKQSKSVANSNCNIEGEEISGCSENTSEDACIQDFTKPARSLRGHNISSTASKYNSEIQKSKTDVETISRSPGCSMIKEHAGSKEILTMPSTSKTEQVDLEESKTVIKETRSSQRQTRASKLVSEEQSSSQLSKSSEDSCASQSQRSSRACTRRSKTVRDLVDIYETTSSSVDSIFQKTAVARSKQRKSDCSQSQTNISEEENKVPGLLDISMSSNAEGSSQASSVAETGRRSSRSRKPTLKVMESTEVAEVNIVNDQSLVVEVGKGKKPTRGTKQKTVVESSIKPVKRLSSEDNLEENVPSKLAKPNPADLFTIPEENNSQNNSLMNESRSSLKRSGALNESFASDISESKRRRGRLDSVASTSTSPRRSPRQSFRGNTNVGITRILFSFYNNPRHESIVKQLGGAVVETVELADVLVTDKLRRTVKILCMVGRGLPIVSPHWLLVSKHAGQWIDPWEHILADQETEIKFGVKLEESLQKASIKPILQDYHILVTKNVKPVPEEMKAIVQSCGGKVLPRAPTTWPPLSVIVSCAEDKAMWSKFKGNAPIVSSEWLLSGVLRQELSTKTNVLLKR